MAGPLSGTGFALFAAFPSAPQMSIKGAPTGLASRLGRFEGMGGLGSEGEKRKPKKELT